MLPAKSFSRISDPSNDCETPFATGANTFRVYPRRAITIRHVPAPVVGMRNWYVPVWLVR